MAEIAKILGDRVQGYYLAGTVGLWKMPRGGMDIGDDLRDLALTRSQILNKVIGPDEYHAISPPLTNKSEIDKVTRFTSSIEQGLEKIGFTEDEDGNFHQLRESIGNHLTAIACIDNPDQDGAALLLEFTTYKGEVRRWTMLRAFLAGEGSAIAEGLLSRGYHFKRKQRSALLDYVQNLGADIEKTYTITDASGWVGKSFVLPHKTYGDEDLRFRDVEPSSQVITELKGSLQEWKDNVSRSQSFYRSSAIGKTSTY